MTEAELKEIRDGVARSRRSGNWNFNPNTVDDLLAHIDALAAEVEALKLDRQTKNEAFVAGCEAAGEEIARLRAEVERLKEAEGTARSRLDNAQFHLDMVVQERDALRDREREATPLVEHLRLIDTCPTKGEAEAWLEKAQQ